MRNLLVLASLAALPLGAAAQDAAVARSLAATCANCHGTNGNSATKEVPSLAGMPRDHIEGQLRAFRAGTKPATVMHQLSKGYTDQQIAAIAAYFSAQKRATP
jgi:sulfide dehydrogenase cytochrome subunit